MSEELPTSTSPTVVSLFSGAGGLDLGLAASGWNIRYATDRDYYSCQTLIMNKESASAQGLSGLEECIVEQADVAELTGAHILSTIGLEVGELGLLAGGPPCQAFSVFGKRRGVEDDRGQLVYEYTRLLSELQPKAFIFENVYGLLTVQEGEVFASVLASLSSPGNDLRYDVTWKRVNARDFSVPQSRDRVILVGMRSDIDASFDAQSIESITSSQEESGKSSWRTVEDALRGLPKVGSGLANHTGRRHSDRIIDRYKALGPGERDSKTRINKLDSRKPSYTVVVGSDAGGGKGHVHPREPREVTPRESARLQTFPDWWKFEGNVRHAIRQVGNAVPPLLGFSIGNSLLSALTGAAAVPLSHALEALGQQHLYAADQKDQESLIPKAS